MKIGSKGEKGKKNVRKGRNEEEKSIKQETVNEFLRLA